MRIDVVELRRGDQRRHGCCPLGTTVGAGEEPCLPSDGKASQAAFGGIVRQADAAIVKEVGEAAPALEHVVDGLGDRRRTGQLEALLAQPGVEAFDEWAALFMPDPAALVGACAIDPALDIKESVNAPHRLHGDGRHRRGTKPTPCACGDVGEFEEASPGMRPAERRRDRSTRTCGIVQAIVAAIGIGLEDAPPAREVPIRMLLPPVARGEVKGCWRIGTAEGPIVTHIGPDPARVGLALGKDGHGRVVGV